MFGGGWGVGAKKVAVGEVCFEIQSLLRGMHIIDLFGAGFGLVC